MSSSDSLADSPRPSDSGGESFHRSLNRSSSTQGRRPSESPSSSGNAIRGHVEDSTRRRSPGPTTQTLSEFLQDRPAPMPPDMSAEDRKRSLMAIDRKRRLTSSTQDGGRCRPTQGGFHDQSIVGQDRRVDGSSNNHQPIDGYETMHHPSHEVVDLTSSPPSTPLAARRQPPPSRGHRLSRTTSHSSRQYVVPAWQHDSEVSACPICKRPFTWMFRRHHCRKCGRVVCNDCSPHRITIPRQFIVHPPGLELPSPARPPTGIRRAETVDLTGDDDEEEDDDDDEAGEEEEEEEEAMFTSSRPRPSLEGGEKVRLCNPCVPDPQPEPLPNYPALIGRPPGSSGSWSSGINRTSDLMSPDNAGIDRRAGGAPNRGRQPSGGTMNVSLVESCPSTFGVKTDTSIRLFKTQTIIMRPPQDDGGCMTLPPETITSPCLARSEANLTCLAIIQEPLLQTRCRQRWQIPMCVYLEGMGIASLTERKNIPPRGSRSSLAAPGPTYSHGRYQSLGSVPSPSLPYGPRPRGRSMLESTSQYPAVARTAPSAPSHTGSSARPRLHERDICPVCRRALPPRGPNGDETARERHIMDCIHARDPSAPSSSEGGGPSHTRIHMLPFTATEKDCVNQDGSLQECSICMVEYDVGDELARLECLCKFHKRCIVEWFARKPECPVHKLVT